jgi:dTMP kinase
VLSSLKGLPMSARAEALIARILSAAPGRLPLLRNAYCVISTSQEATPERTPRPVASSEPRASF